MIILFISVILNGIVTLLSCQTHFGLYITAQKVSKALRLPLRGPKLSKWIKAHGGPYAFILRAYLYSGLAMLVNLSIFG